MFDLRKWYSKKFRPHETSFFSLVILILAVANGVFHLKTPFDSWFEDDPMIFSVVRTVNNPIDFFLNPKASSGAVGENEVAPVLLASFWFDNFFSPRDPQFAYWHSIILYALTGFLLFFTAKRITASNFLSFFAALFWLMLPSTQVIVEFLSARHYMYGLFFAFLCFELASRLPSKISNYQESFPWIGFGLCLWFCLISKELFPPAILTFFFLKFFFERKYLGLGLCVLEAIGYLLYRLWMTDPGVTYRNLPMLGLQDFLVFLARLPYMFLGKMIAYPLLIAIALIYIFHTFFRSKNFASLFLFFMTLVFAVLTILPVAMPVSMAWKSLGTWYRTPFAINTLLVFGIFRALSVLSLTWINRVIIVVLLFTLVDAGHIMSKHWDRMKIAQRMEGDFFLRNPDKLLFSWTEAYWYLLGLRQLYPEVQPAKFISRWPAISENGRKALLDNQDVWMLSDGRMERKDRHQIEIILTSIP